MSLNPTPNKVPTSISVSKVVSAALRLYRDHFGLYFGLAIKAYLWLFIPVYGWAKFSAILGLLSRLAFCELIEHPETLSQARRYVNSRMWQLLLAGFLVILILFGVMIGIGIVLIILLVLLAVALDNIIKPGIWAFIVSFGLVLFAVVAYVFLYTWFYSRLSVVELPLAIENDVNSTTAIGRSWNLTKNYNLRLMEIFLSAFFMALLLYIAVRLVSYIAQSITLTLSPSISDPIYVLIVLLIIISSSAILLPFWQALKAVIYYDLRSRTRRGEFVNF